MSWKKHFKPVDAHSSPSPLGSGGIAGPAKTNYTSFLPDVYAGSPNRIDRYLQFDTMDSDSEVNAALDIISEFCTQKDGENETPFHVMYRGSPTSTEVKLIKDCLQKWNRLQQFETRIFKVIRNTFKYGDCFFLRDPETKKWLYVDPAKVTKIIANESEGKIPSQYIIKDINFNFKNLIAVTPHNVGGIGPGGGASYSAAGLGRGMVGDISKSTGSRFQNATNEIAVDAKNMIHISLSEGLDSNYPFGNSLLESVFKVYKQKELLEDAIIIYRVQRAPERRVFYVDTGSMPAHLAMGFVERVKNEIQQRRIPSATGGQGSAGAIDSSYNPVSQSEDFYFPQNCIKLDTGIVLLDGRTLTLAELITEFESGVENFTYTVNQQTLAIEPGKIVWAGITRKNAEVVEVLLDNGDILTTTPDHRFIMRDGSEVEAQFLKENDLLATSDVLVHTGTIRYVKSVTVIAERFDTGDLTIESSSDSHNFATAAGVFIHNSEGRGSKVDVLPGGCLAMDTKVPLLDGRVLSLAELTDEYQNGITNWTYSADPETGKVVPGIISWAGVTQTDATVMRLVFDNGESLICTPDHKFPIIGKGKVRADELVIGESFIPFNVKNAHISKTKKRNYTQVYQNFDKKWEFVHRLVVAELIDIILSHFNEINTGTNCKKWTGTINSSKLSTMIKQFGYTNWRHFKNQALQYNHKLVSIEYLSDKIEVGTLTIDQDEVHHDYHNFALSIGIFTQNSNLGEITDLRYFTNKLFRALRIPAAYLPTGIEESSNTVADGKVGTAYIQEFRFNEYCKRLQNMLIGTFDIEFKLWLYSQGINIDSSLFELKFNAPQNFAAYRQTELDTTRVSIFTQLQEIPHMSKRFAMKRFLGMTQEEIVENEQLWREENGHKLTSPVDSAGEMRSAGISPVGMSADMATQSEEAPMDTAGESNEVPAATAGASTAPAAPTTPGM